MRHWVAGGVYTHKSGGGFMGQAWDAFVPSPAYWREVIRVLKPGGHALVFAGTRTSDLMGVALRFAGFEIRDTLVWMYGSGFPKSMDVSKAVDKHLGCTRTITGENKWAHKGNNKGGTCYGVHTSPPESKPGSGLARRYEGFGTALKPAHEPIILCRKPLDRQAKTVAANVLKHGTGGLHIDACRVAPTDEQLQGGGTIKGKFSVSHHEGWCRPWMRDARTREAARIRSVAAQAKGGEMGRWPANLIHDGSRDVLPLFPTGKSGGNGRPPSAGSAARYFYCAKASPADRDEGLDTEARKAGAMKGNLTDGQRKLGDGTPISAPLRKNHHPTVKPTALMRHLCRLICPPGGTVLDPFMGSGSTGKAAVLEGFAFIGVEQQADYMAIAAQRIQCAKDKKDQATSKENGG